MKNSNIYLKAMYYKGNHEKKINVSWICIAEKGHNDKSKNKVKSNKKKITR